MRALYAAAICVVTPSRAAGFSLPVIEAAAAQSPAVVSDIAAHRALVTDPALRFAPDDAERLAAILERLVQDKPYRAAVVAQQWPIWQPFSAAAVAGKVWSALSPARPALHRKAKPQLAMITPLPPAKSGVADYSGRTGQALAARVKLTLFTEETVKSAAPLRRNFDRAVSAIGNSSLHANIYDHALKWGHATICHDARLLGLTSGLGLDHAADLASAEIGRRVLHPRKSTIGRPMRAPARRVFWALSAQAARPLIFHAPQPVELVQRRFSATARYLPLAIYRPFDAPATSTAKQVARATLQLDPMKKLIASFGFVSASKGIDKALRAFALLRETTDASCCSSANSRTAQTGSGCWRVSSASPMPCASAAPSFRKRNDRLHLLAVDGALQLRRAGAGQISGALQDCIAAGLPTVASHDLAENLQAPGYVHRVSDQLDPREIAQALAAMLDSGGRHRHETERADYCADHSMTRYANTLLEILEI